jgi:hypothetical protein
VHEGGAIADQEERHLGDLLRAPEPPERDRALVLAALGGRVGRGGDLGAEHRRVGGAGTEHVDPPEEVEDLVVRVLDRADERDAGVVEEDVDRARGCEAGVGRGVESGAVGEIDRMEDEAGAELRRKRRSPAPDGR